MKILSVLRAVLPEGVAFWRAWNIRRLLESGGHEVHFVHYFRRRSSGGVGIGREVDDCLLVKDSLAVHLVNLELVVREKYDLIYGNMWSGAFCSILARISGAPLVFDVHGGYAEEHRLVSDYSSNSGPKVSPGLFWKELVESVSLKLSDKIVCVSKRMMSYLDKEKRVPQEKMAYVTNGVDLKLFRPGIDSDVEELRAKLGIQGKLVFGYAGGFQKYQGIENFMKAAETIDDRNLAFIVVGEGKNPGCSGVSFIPKVPRSEIPKFYSACDVLVLPRPRHAATEIAAPTKFGEYVAMGKPVLATDVGDASDFVRNSRCGIVVKDNGIESLAKGILEFKERSESELKTMGRNSRFLAEREFDWKKISSNLLDAVESLI